MGKANTATPTPTKKSTRRQGLAVDVESQKKKLKEPKVQPKALKRAQAEGKKSTERTMTNSPTKETKASPSKTKKSAEPTTPTKTSRRSERKQSPGKGREKKPAPKPAEEDDEEDVENDDVDDDDDDEDYDDGGNSNLKFKCSFCDRGFKRKYDMEKHSRSHTGDKPYKCGVCGKQVKKLDPVTI